MMKNNLVFDRKQVLKGFLLAPLISCAFTGLIFLLLALVLDFVALVGFVSSLSLIDALRLIAGYGSTFVFAICIAYLMVILFGMPYFLLLKYFKVVNLFTILIGAYCASVLGSCAVLVISIGEGLPPFDLAILLLIQLLFYPFHLITLFGAFLFWWIAVRPAIKNS